MSILSQNISFGTIKRARLGQKEFKKKYGYRPNLYIRKSATGKIIKVIIVKPKGLIKI